MPGEVTQLLLRWSEGEEAALAKPMPIFYGELRRADRASTLEPAALVHEIWLRLAGPGQIKPRYTEIVETRYPEALAIYETAAVLHGSHTTVEREWNFARSRLRREVQREGRQPANRKGART